MHHAALDRAGPHDRHFHHQVIEFAGTQPRQHVHLGAAFHLEHADGIGPAQHVVHHRIFLRHGGKAQLLFVAGPGIGMNQVESLADAGQHPQRQDIDLHDRQSVEIVLVPFDEIAVVHGGGADGHCPVQLVAGQDKAADMLGQVAGKAHQPVGKRHRALHRGIGRVAFALPYLVLFQFVAMMAPYRVRQLAGDVFGQAEHLADFADGAARTIVNDRGGQGGAAMAIALDRYTG